MKKKDANVSARGIMFSKMKNPNVEILIVIQISWTTEKDLKALTNKLLKMYLKQKGLTINGSKAELIDRVLTHTRGNLSARDPVENEESPNSCEDDTSSESSDSDDSSKESFEVMFVPKEEIQQVN